MQDSLPHQTLSYGVASLVRGYLEYVEWTEKPLCLLGMEARADRNLAVVCEIRLIYLKLKRHNSTRIRFLLAFLLGLYFFTHCYVHIGWSRTSKQPCCIDSHRMQLKLPRSAPRYCVNLFPATHYRPSR